MDAVGRFNRFDKKARTFGTDQELFVAEIHLIDFVGSNGDCCISDIAKSIRVTKGAVSQMVKKLEKKGYLVKREDSQNKAKVVVRLTPKGGKAFAEHRQYHRELDEKVAAVVEKYDQQQKKVICQFLQEIQETWK